MEQFKYLELPVGKSLNFVKTQPKTIGYTKERNDCTVRAVALAFDIHYDKAYKFLEKNGRKPNKGFWINGLLGGSYNYKKVTLFGKRVIRIPCLLTLQQTMKNIGDGAFIWQNGYHCFCIRNGIILDTFIDRPGSRCKGLWNILD